MKNTYEVDNRNGRIVRVKIKDHNLRDFLNEVQMLNYAGEHFLSIPTEIYRLKFLAHRFIDNEDIENIRSIFHDRNRGGISIELPQWLSTFELKLIIISIGMNLGAPKLDKNASPISVFDSSAKKTSLNLNTTQTLPLHNDGTFYSGDTDWLMLVLGSDESLDSSSGSLLAHLDDWLKETKFDISQFGSQRFTFKGPTPDVLQMKILSDRGESTALERQIFYQHPTFGLSSRVAFQWLHPKNDKEASMILELFDSLLKYQSLSMFKLIKHEMYVVNNHFWLHGRLKSSFMDQNRMSIRMFGNFH